MGGVTGDGWHSWEKKVGQSEVGAGLSRLRDCRGAARLEGTLAYSGHTQCCLIPQGPRFQLLHYSNGEHSRCIQSLKIWSICFSHADSFNRALAETRMAFLYYS
jgi:hypothetical protein